VEAGLDLDVCPGGPRVPGYATALFHKCFVLCNLEILLRAFKVYVRPLLEYATCVWSPHYNYAIDKTEAVQRKFTRG